MPFIWNDQPNSHSTDLPVPVPPGQITYESREVANLVNAGGALSYNTPNIGFDIIYEISSLSVMNLQITTLNAESMTINTANISAATINTALITTANFANVVIRYGFMANNPSSNLEIATKGYADGAAANVPAGGSDLEDLIDAKGDLLVGVSANTLTRLPVGTPGQVLSVDNSTTSGLRWKNISGSSIFFGLLLQTHYTPSLTRRQILLINADAIYLDNGSIVSQWRNLVADITVSGAGGLDTGTEQASRWYEVWAIRNSTTAQRTLLLHLASNTLLDQSHTPTTDNGRDVRLASDGNSRLAQSFIPANAGPLTSAEIEVTRTGAPTGLIWLTLETDNAGFPSGTAIATSRVMDVARLPTDKARVRFLFDANTSVSTNTTYHIVYQGNYTLSDTNYTTIWGTTANGYADGRANEFRLLTSTWRRCTDSGGPADLYFKVFVQISPITDVTMPSGYDEKALISYVYNDSSSDFKPYRQKDRIMVMGVGAPWRAFTPNTALVEAVDLTAFVPPLSASVVQFTLVQVGGQGIVPIGIVSATDMSISNTPSPGVMAANTSIGNGTSTGPFGEIVVENQVMLARMKNLSSRLYVSLIRF